MAGFASFAAARFPTLFAAVLGACMFVPSQTLAQPPCVLEYDFEEGSAPNGLLLDSSGFMTSLNMQKFSGANGTPPTYSADVPTSGDGHAYAGSSLRIGRKWSMGWVSPGSNHKDELQQITVEAWVKLPATATGPGAVICHVPPGAGCIGRGWSLQVGPNGAAFVVGVDPSSVGPVIAVLAAQPLLPDRWYHIAGSFDGMTLRAFIDGAQLASTPAAGPIDYGTGTLGNCVGGPGPSVTTVYLSAYHNANASGPTVVSELEFGLFENTLVDRVRVLAGAVQGIHGNLSPAPQLDYYHCHLVIDEAPSSVITCGTAAATFSVTAAGSGPLTYHWRKGTVPIDAVANPSAASSTLLLTNVRASDADSYDCVVSNACGSVISNPATLRVCGADFDCDGTADFFDYDAFVTCFEGGTCPPGRTADFDGDGAVDFFDYDAFVRAFEMPC